MKRIYLDYAAATPMDEKVLFAMQPYFSQNFYNPSANYLSARAVKQQLNQFRSSIAKALGAKPAEIIFTAGATEANNLSIQGVGRQYPDGEILVSAIEHESVLAPAGLFKTKQIPVDEAGIILLNKLSNLINDKTVLISVMLVNNELGTLQPLSEIAAMVKTIRQTRRTNSNHLPLYLHTDAAQAGNYLDIHVSRLGVDMLSLNGGKIYGPKQSGILYLKTGLKLQPIIVGGGQEFNLRSGTENIAAAAGLAEALDLAIQKRTAENKRVRELRNYFQELVANRLPMAVINGHKSHRAPHILSITTTGTDNERLMMELDERGIECAVGSACAASSDELSHVLSAIGLNQNQIRSTLRFSFGRFTTKNDIQRTVEDLVNLTAQ